jgi:hypothetical protein
MNSSMIAILQFVVTIACAFFFGFKGIELFLGDLQLAVRILLGIGAALIVGGAELYFLAINIAVSEEAYSNNPTVKQPKPVQLSSKNIPHLKTS